MNFLVVGCDGFIGSYLVEECRRRGINYIGTSRHRERTDHCIPFTLGVDTTGDIVETALRSGVDTAVIAAGITSIQRCFDDQVLSYAVNVVSTIDLISTLNRAGIKTVFLSSDTVFDGRNGNYSEEDEANPRSVYGRQKYDVEEFVLRKCEKGLVLRLAKQYDLSGSNGLFTDIYKEIRTKGRVRNIRGLKFNPTFVRDTADAIIKAAENKLKGLYNVAASESWNRQDIATMLLREIGYDSNLAAEYDICEFGFDEGKPLNTTMNVSKWLEATGMEFMSLHYGIARFAQGGVERIG